MTRLRTIAIVWGIALAFPAQAHEFWIEPPAPPAADRTTGLHLFVGDGFPGEEFARNPNHLVAFKVIGPKRTTEVTGRSGQAPAGRVRLEEDGVHVAIYRSGHSSIEMEARAFEAYLLEEGLDQIVALRASRGEQSEPGRERFSRCAKTIWRQGAGAADAAIRSMGLRFEITPLANPLALKPGDRLEVEVRLDGDAARGIVLHTFRRGVKGPVQRLRTDERGRATIELGEAGTWMVSGVSMEPATDAKVATWNSEWSSMTFVIDRTVAESP